MRVRESESVRVRECQGERVDLAGVAAKDGVLLPGAPHGGLLARARVVAVPHVRPRLHHPVFGVHNLGFRNQVTVQGVGTRLRFRD